MGLTPNQSRSGRTYDWDGESYISVTTILNVLNKPALPAWASKSAAQFVVNNFPMVSSLIGQGQGAAAVDLIKGSPWRQRDKAADLGSAVHHAVEALQGGFEVKIVDEEVVPYLKAFVAWYEHFHPDILVSEGTVFNRPYDYAGTLDIIARVEGLTWLIDVKSGKGVYPEHAMQIAAYAQAEFIGHQDGTEEPLPIIDRGAVLHLRPEGYHFIPVLIGKEVFDSFLYCRELFRWQDDIAHRAILPEIRKNSGVTEPFQARVIQAKELS